MGDLKKQYTGDKVAELLAAGEYERAVEMSGAGFAGFNPDQLGYTDPVNHDRVFVGLPIALGELQQDDPLQDEDDVALYASEWSREND